MSLDNIIDSANTLGSTIQKVASKEDEDDVTEKQHDLPQSLGSDSDSDNKIADSIVEKYSDTSKKIDEEDKGHHNIDSID